MESEDKLSGGDNQAAGGFNRNPTEIRLGRCDGLGNSAIGDMYQV